MTFGLGLTRSVVLNGLDGVLVDVEAHIGQGLPYFAVGGTPDPACAQAPDRVEARRGDEWGCRSRRTASR